jgi:hypothetical protein
MVSRGVPAASRADAKSKSRATWSAYPSDYPATGTSEPLHHATNEPQPVNITARSFDDNTSFAAHRRAPR